jgi:hypothetical protein
VALYGENNRAIVGQMFGVHYDWPWIYEISKWSKYIQRGI